MAIVVSPGNKPDRLVCRLSGEQAVEQTSRESVAAADTIVDVELARRRDVRMTSNPGDCSPGMAVRGVHVAKRRRHHLDSRIAFDDALDHPEEGARIERGCGGFRGHLRARNPEAFLKVLFVAHQHVDVFDDARERGNGAVGAAGGAPELLAVVQIE